MGIKTEQMVTYLPGKEITEGVDWLGILDSFDPAGLEEKYINECARRNPYDTCYKWESPAMPVEERIKSSESFVAYRRRELEECVRRIENEGLTPLTYKLARAALIKAIGEKGALEYNRREYERLGEEGRKAQAREYARFEKEWKEARAREEQERQETMEAGCYFYAEPEPASVHEKIVMVRKGLKGSDGKPLTQRDFAKLLGYPVNKYAEAEKVDRYGRGDQETEVEDELLEKLVMIAHANPYWLFDHDCEAYMANDSVEAEEVLVGNEPCVYAKVDIILKWIKEGKPKNTWWDDGITRYEA